MDRPDTLESYGFDMPEELGRRSILRVAADAPEADVLVVTGAGVRTLTLIEAIEAESGRPLVAADTAAYWAAAQALEPGAHTLHGSPGPDVRLSNSAPSRTVLPGAGLADVDGWDERTCTR